MALTQENRYFLDGIDLWLGYRVGVESGSDDFLRMPKKKEGIQHDWQDENGLDVDLSRIFLEAKEVELKCHILAPTEADFWISYDALLATLTKPGVRRLTITEFGRDFYVFYKSCEIYTRFTRLLDSNLVACKFTLKLMEKNPTASALPPSFLVDEAGRFIIT